MIAVCVFSVGLSFCLWSSIERKGKHKTRKEQYFSPGDGRGREDALGIDRFGAINDRIYQPVQTDYNSNQKKKKKSCKKKNPAKKSHFEV